MDVELIANWEASRIALTFNDLSFFLCVPTFMELQQKRKNLLLDQHFSELKTMFGFKTIPASGSCSSLSLCPNATDLQVIRPKIKHNINLIDPKEWNHRNRF